MLESVLAGVVAGYGIAIPVGAIAAYLITLGARDGWRTGAAGGLGAATVDGLYASVAVTAGALIAPWLEGIRDPLRWGAAIVLFALGVWLLLPAFRRGTPSAAPDTPRAPKPWRAYVTVLGLTLINPTTVLYFVALVAGTDLGSDAEAAERIAFVVAVFAASASWQLLLVTGGAVLGRWLRGPAGRRITAVAGGVLVIGLAVWSLIGA